MNIIRRKKLSSKDYTAVWLCETDSGLCIQKEYNNLLYPGDDIKNEYELISEINHPRIPKILSFVQNDTSTSVFYEYIKGMTIREYVDINGTIDEKTALSWLMQICSILEYLHENREKPIIHRDIKPANIIITGSGDLYLIDFGIARSYKPKNELDTRLLGSHGFASPEQYGFHQSDCRSDIFSTAVTIYYALTGYSLAEPPYQLLPLSSINHAFSKKLSSILIKATVPDPDNRYQTASEIKKDTEKHYKSFINRKRRKLLVAASVIAVIAAASISVAVYSGINKYRNIPHPDSPAVNMPDSNLYNALVAAGLDYYPDGILTEDELRKSEIDLFLNNRGISDVTGMEFLERTVHLEMRSNPVSDVTPITSMTSLEVLYLDSTDIDSLEGFERLTLLQLLSIEDTDISDLTPIYNLSLIHDLWIRQTKVSDIYGIEALTALRDFNLGFTQIEDISPLSQLDNMNMVGLSNSKISSIIPLANKTNMKQLNVSENRIDFTDPNEKAALDNLLSNGVEVLYESQSIN